MEFKVIKEKVLKGESVTDEELTFLIDEVSEEDLTSSELKNSLNANYKSQLEKLFEETKTDTE